MCEQLLIVAQGCMISKGLASLKICDSFLQQLSITAVQQTVNGQVYVWQANMTVYAHCLQGDD